LKPNDIKARLIRVVRLLTDCWQLFFYLQIRWGNSDFWTSCQATNKLSAPKAIGHSEAPLPRYGVQIRQATQKQEWREEKIRRKAGILFEAEPPSLWKRNYEGSGEQHI
jgi:hypothetical protein